MITEAAADLDLKPARLIECDGFHGHANEVGLHNPALLARASKNPVYMWTCRHLSKDRRHSTPQVHLDIYDALLYKRRVVARLFRSGGKTTCVKNTVGFFMTEYPNIVAGLYPGVFPHTAIRIISGNGDKAREILDKIVHIFEDSDTISAAYPDMEWGKRANLKWSPASGEIEVRWGKQTITVSAAGRGATIRGYRPTLLILDDLDDDEEVMSDERLEKAFKWFDSAVYNTIDEEEYQVFVVGTVVEETCIINYIADKPEFEVVDYDAYTWHEAPEEEGYEIWPSKWSHIKLQIRKDNINLRAFMAEFRGMPQPSDNPIFERHWFVPYDPDSEEYRELKRLSFHSKGGCDPATSKKDKTDYNALVVLQATFELPRPRIYLPRGGVKRGYWTAKRTVEEIYKMVTAYDLAEVIIEDVAYQFVLVEFVEDFMNERQYNLPITPKTCDGDKERRANRVAPWAQQGLVHYDPNDPEHLALINECVLFKRGVMNIKKDRMDAFVHCLTAIMEWARDRGAQESKAGRVVPKGYHLQTAGGGR